MASALEYITIQGFRSIASIEKLPLKPVNVLIGPNGSGKSNFIGAFSFLHEIREGQLRRYVKAAGGAERVLHFGSKVTRELSFELGFQPDHARYRLTLAASAEDALFTATEHFTERGKDLAFEGRPGAQDGWEATISDPWISAPSSLARMRQELAGWRVYHLNDTSGSSPLRKTVKLDDNRFLKPDGSNLAAFLYFLKVSSRSSYDQIVKTIRLVAPFFEDFILEPLQLSPDNIKLEWRHQRSDQYFDASSLSDGTLRFLTLATLLLQPETLRPSVILVDEPELGLHPAAIEVLAALVRQASVISQVVISTQSSILLDHFQPEDVLVADRVRDATQIRRLDSVDLKRWLEDYSLGQLWEKNEIGGRPLPS